MSLKSPLGATQGGTIEFARDGLTLPAVRSTSRAGLVALGVLLAATAALCLCAAETNLLLPETSRPVPMWLAGVFGHAGVGLGTIPLVGLLALAFGAYSMAVSRAGRLSATTVLGSIAALHAVVLLAPPLLSTDVFSYQGYARMLAQYHTSPYLHGPYAIELDPVYQFIGAKWIHTPTAYGPIFTAFSALLAPLSIAASVVAYKAIAVVASLVVIALVWNIARLRGLDPVKSVALVGLNPLVVLYGVGGGHNDMLMLAAMLAAIALLLRHRERAAAVSLVAGVAIKLTAGLLAPFAYAGIAGSRVRSRRREFLVAGALVTLTIAIATLITFGTGSLHLLHTLRQNQARGDWHSIPGFLATRVGFGTIGHVTGIVLGCVFVAVAAWLVRRVWRGELDWIDGAAWATVAMLLTASSMLPWYVAWLMPLAAVARDPRLPRASIRLTWLVAGITMLGYIPHGSSVLGL
jgi:alpha-1,6-mannosyltransferase